MSNVTTTFPPHVPAYVESPRLSPWSSTVHYVHSSQYPYFISFVKSPSVCWRHNFSCLFAHLTESSVTHLQNALQHISSWMTANLLTLNSSKTEFLLIGLQQQLTKIHNCSLYTIDSARNLGFIFDSHLTFSDQISSLSSLVIITFVNFVVSSPILASKLPVPLHISCSL